MKEILFYMMTVLTIQMPAPGKTYQDLMKSLALTVILAILIYLDDTDGAPDPDAGDGDDAGTETGDALGDSGTSSGEENGEGSEEETDTEADSEDEDTAETDISETLLFDTEVLTEIRDTLSIHTDSMDGFVSSLTISGNSLTVSLDDGDAALLAETISNQTEILDGLDSLGIMLSLVFLVLIYDLLQRSAKRFVKNLTGGEKNGTNT